VPQSSSPGGSNRGLRAHNEDVVAIELEQLDLAFYVRDGDGRERVVPTQI
jgi:hypothetical protein